jgi:hypothetical protein
LLVPPAGGAPFCRKRSRRVCTGLTSAAPHDLAGRVTAPDFGLDIARDARARQMGSKARLMGWLCMLSVQIRNRPTIGQLARAHTFRFLTMIAAWVLIFAAFAFHPEWIRAWLRFMTHAIESVADQVPEPWGSRLEIMLRELGGVIWIQIASAIVLLRLIIWVPFHLWRLRRERRTQY